MSSPRRVYWDACAWIAYIARETAVRQKDGSTENRFTMCQAVLKAAEAGKIEIVTSAFTLAEVCKAPDVKGSPIDNLPAFFEKSYILIVPVDLSVGRRAQTMQASGLVSLKPPDAIHLASALRADAPEINTFDTDLLKLDGTIPRKEGDPLKIIKPGTGGSPLPLLDAADE